MKRGLGILALVLALFLFAGLAFAQNDDLFVVVAGGKDWRLTGNAGTTAGTHFLGTTDNQPVELRVNSARALRLEPNTSPNVIGGHSVNAVSPGINGATIGGGGAGGFIATPNSVSADYGTVGGGRYNAADGLSATVGGGYGNTASGKNAAVGGGEGNTASGESATVGGGHNNTAIDQHATVGGGENNTASGYYATIGGGVNNEATNYATVGGGTGNVADGPRGTVAGGMQNRAGDYYAAVPGGWGNRAMGEYSFAAGRRAVANNDGCFVWADSTPTDETTAVRCDNDDRWLARAKGGVYFYTSGDLSTGTYLAAGGSSWNMVSAKDLKENFVSIDTEKLVARLAEMPITTWNYKAQHPAIRHIGPSAQNFNELIEGLGGEGENHVNTLDAHGVAFAAIQGLYKMLKAKEERIQELETRLARIEALMENALKAKALRLSRSEW
jgi:hypothetical protein